jgi:glycosyltransferase involved in cell wall biosynthesis
VLDGPEESDGAQPLVSVVLPTHLSPPPFLEEAVASVVDQTWTRWELIVVDDGSPDPDTVPALVAGVDSRMGFVRAPRGGAARARNLGAAHSHGSLITFLDHDDVWYPQHLSRAVAALAEDPAAVVAFSAMEIVDADRQHPRLSAGHGVSRHTVLSGGARPSLNAMVVRRESFDEIGGFDPGHDGSEDLDFIFKLVEQGPFTYVDEVTAIYRIHDKNWSRDTRRTAVSHDEMLQDHLRRARRRGDVDAADDLRTHRRNMRRFYASRAVDDAIGQWRGRQPRAAAALAWWGLRFSPIGVAKALGKLASRRWDRVRDG